MTLYKKILLALFSVVLFVALFYGYVFYVWTIGIEEEHRGLKEGVARSAANDSPIDLPKNATDIYYAYELYWQGGCSIVRYRLPTGDLKKQAATHLRAAVPWVDPMQPPALQCRSIDSRCMHGSNLPPLPLATKVTHLEFSGNLKCGSTM